jgi:ankyrin repeat protein
VDLSLAASSCEAGSQFVSSSQERRSGQAQPWEIDKVPREKQKTCTHLHTEQKSDSLMQYQMPSNSKTDSGDESISFGEGSYSTSVNIAKTIPTLRPEPSVSIRHCGCQCHEYVACYYRFTGGRLGSILLSQTGRVFGTTLDCDQKMCGRCHVSKLVAVYYAPRWLSRSGVSFSTWSSGRLQMSLSFPRVLPPDTELFVCIRMGRVGRIKELLASGEASVADIAAPYGLTPLNLAIIYGQRDISELLYLEGAPQIPLRSWVVSDLWDYFDYCSLIDSTMTPAAVFRDYMKLCIPKGQGDGRKGWSEEARLEGAHFSRLHRSVLGLSLETVESIGSGLRCCINDIDSFGRTALYWAAKIGRSDLVECLLLHGADPGISDRNGSTPLHVAAGLGYKCCIDVLLRAGAYIQARDRFGGSPLHSACNRQDADITEFLLDRGADIEAVNHFGENAILTAINATNIDAVGVLIERGTSLAHVDTWGHSPLSNAVFMDCHGALEFLLTNKEDYSFTIHDGKTLLHLAARNSDMKTIEMLLNTELRGLDPHAVDNLGHTALEYVQQRKRGGTSLLEPFVALILQTEVCFSKENSDMRYTDSMADAFGADDQDDLFEDAFEFQI